MTVATQWADFITSTRYSDLPADVIHRMKRSLLDALGVGIIGSRHPTSRKVLAYFSRQGGVQEATVVPNGIRTTAANTAIVFGTYMHAPELAESFTRGMMHSGNAVIPSALAEAERVEASGRDLLTAMAVGYEVSIRAGLAIRVHRDSLTFAAKDERRPEYNWFVHFVPTFGIYGATAAAAKLLRLDAEATAHALTLCTSLTPAIGLQPNGAFRPAGADGSMAKDLFQGYGNGLGVIAAELAGLGFTGPPDVTDHFASLVKDYSPELLTRDLGRQWLISSGGLHFKLHSTAGMTQSAADAILDAVNRGPIDPDQVESVDVWVNQRGTRLCADPAPPSPVAAKLSVPYVVSAILCFQDDVKRDPHFTELYTDDKFADARRQALSLRVKVIGDDDYERGFETEWPMRFPARATIRLRSGETIMGEAEIWSVSSNLSDDYVIGKFKDLASRVLPRGNLDTAVEKTFAIDGHVSVGELVRSVCQ
jgi:2-methylcitrate dehydratase PrpD